jgi:hypothetical protein
LSSENENNYPNCPVIIRKVEVGGLTKTQLINKLHENHILINSYGERLLADDKFTPSDKCYMLQTVELTVRDLGFRDGGTINQIFAMANDVGLNLCPVELGPYLRLQYVDQREGNSGTEFQKNQAPSGSITIASKILCEDDNFPKGFYIRKINGDLWLRGYIADDTHVWNPEDRFIFVLKEN